jgi:hypothetical protein
MAGRRFQVVHSYFDGHHAYSIYEVVVSTDGTITSISDAPLLTESSWNKLYNLVNSLKHDVDLYDVIEDNDLNVGYQVEEALFDDDAYYYDDEGNVIDLVDLFERNS